MIYKYIRHDALGFILWPSCDVWHKHIADLTLRREGGKIVSAGFVEFEKGSHRCYGMSESLNIHSDPRDTDDLAAQIGL